MSCWVIIETFLVTASALRGTFDENAETAILIRLSFRLKEQAGRAEQPTCIFPVGGQWNARQIRSRSGPPTEAREVHFQPKAPAM